MTKCKCGCGLEIRKGVKKSQEFYNRDHYLKYSVKNPRKNNVVRDPDRLFHFIKLDPLKGIIKEHLEKKGFPMYISRFSFTSDIIDRGLVGGMSEKEMKQGITLLMPSFGYQRRSDRSYERINVSG
jgi:hypothetical protein